MAPYSSGKVEQGISSGKGVSRPVPPREEEEEELLVGLLFSAEVLEGVGVGVGVGVEEEGGGV